MPSYIEMPSLSDTMTEGTLLKWHIKPGDEVKAGQVIADIQTDKATMEQVAYESGRVHKLYVKEGDKVPLGGAMAMLLEEGEEPPQDDSPPPPKAAAPAAAAASAASSSTRTPRTRGAGRPTASRGRLGRIKASPLARKIAEERGIDLRTVVGTGPGGRIVKADVLEAEKKPAAAAAGLPVIRPTVGPDDERVPLTQMRNIIASRLLASKMQIPHFYLNVEIDAGPLMAFRAQANQGEEAKKSGVKFTVNDFIVKAVALAAREVPAVNAAFDGDALVRFAHVNVSVAIAIEDGLVTPVIPDTDKKSLYEINAAVKDLAKRARENKLRPEEFNGGTLTLSNLGAYGIDSFAAIINPPQAIIISVGAVVKKPVVGADGQLTVGERMWLGLSADHRVVDGAVGALYLQALRRYLESPALMLI